MEAGLYRQATRRVGLHACVVWVCDGKREGHQGGGGSSRWFPLAALVGFRVVPRAAMGLTVSRQIRSLHSGHAGSSSHQPRGDLPFSSLIFGHPLEGLAVSPQAWWDRPCLRADFKFAGVTAGSCVPVDWLRLSQVLGFSSVHSCLSMNCSRSGVAGAAKRLFLCLAAGFQECPDRGACLSCSPSKGEWGQLVRRRPRTWSELPTKAANPHRHGSHQTRPITADQSCKSPAPTKRGPELPTKACKHGSHQTRPRAIP